MNGSFCGASPETVQTQRSSGFRHFHLRHSTNTVAANYGSGYALEVMQEALMKAWEE